MDGTAILVKPFFHYNFLTVQTKTLLECVVDVQPVDSFRSAIGDIVQGGKIRFGGRRVGTFDMLYIESMLYSVAHNWSL